MRSGAASWRERASSPLPFTFSLDINITTIAVALISLAGFYLGYLRMRDQVTLNSQRLTAQEIELAKKANKYELNELGDKVKGHDIGLHAFHQAVFAFREEVAKEYVSLRRFEIFEDKQAEQRQSMKDELLAGQRELGERFDRMIERIAPRDRSS